MHFQTLPNLVISGATGFVGRAAADATDEAVEAGRFGGVRRMVRDRGRMPAGRDSAYGDLTDPFSLAAALQGAGALIHAAGYRGPDPALQQRVNVDGTQALVEAAVAAGVERIVVVSTTAVYGSGVHRGEAAGGLAPHPESSLSLSRLAAEQIVLAAGGYVVRADLTYGDGDCWVVPGLVRVQRMLGGAVDGGAALTSAIPVTSLGRLIVALAAARDVRQRVFHAAAHPVPLSALIGAVETATGLGLPTGQVTRSEALPLLTEAGMTPHEIDLITADHWYDGTPLWTLAGLEPATEPVIDASAAAWYARTLNTNHA